MSPGMVMEVRRWLWEKRQALRRGEPEWDGFISYKDDTDGALAKALQAQLLHFGAPVLLVIRRPLRVFLDRPNLTGPQLWEKLAGAIVRSRWLIVIASPEAANSEWVCREVSHFLEHAGERRQNIQIVLTAGEIHWDDAAADFDWATTTALPPPLAGVFPKVPRYLDLRWTRGQRQFAMTDGRFRDAVRDLSRTLRGQEGFQQSEEEQRLQNRRRILAATVVLILVIATATAWWQKGVADRERDRAMSMRLLAESKAMLAGTSPGGDIRAIQELLLSQEFADPPDHGVLLNALVDRRTTEKIIDTSAVVNSAAVTRDGTRIATAGADSVVRIWDADTGAEVRQLTGHHGQVLSIAYSSDGRMIATGGEDATVRLWDVSTDDTEPTVLQAAGPVKSLAFRSDGLVLASAGTTPSVQLWDVVDGRGIDPDPHVERDVLRTVAFGTDDRLATGGLYGRIRVWDTATGTEEPGKIMAQGNGEPVGALAFSPDGHWIVAGSGNGILRLWNADTREKREADFRPGHDDVVTAVAFSPDGNRIVSGGGDQALRVWNAKTLKMIGEPLVGHQGAITAVAFTDDGDRIVSASADSTVRIWDPEPALPVTAGGNRVVSVAYSHDGTRIVTTSDDSTLRIWDAATHRPVTPPLKGPGGGVNAAAFSADDRQVVTGSFDRNVQLWNADTGTPIGEPLTGHTAAVRDVATSKDGLIASVGDDRRVLFWDPRTREHTQLARASSEVLCVDFSPDGHLLAFGTASGQIEVWDVETRTSVATLTGHRDKVRDVVFDRDGARLASASVDATVRLWDVAQRKQIGEPLVGNHGVVWKVGYSPDGRLLASAGRDGTVRLWDADDGHSIASPFTGHTGPVRGVAFSPDGTQLASVGDDRTMRFWPVTASRDILCAKLSTNMSEQDWSTWISTEIDYRKACVNLPVAG